MTDSATAAGGRVGRLLDISRMLSRLRRKAPTGIDRVELAYARHYLEAVAERDLRCLLATPVNCGLVARRLASGVVRTAIERWAATSGDLATDTAFAELVATLRAPLHSRPPHRTIGVVEPSTGIADVRAASMQVAAYVQATLRGAFNPWMNRVSGEAFWYVNVSHVNLRRPTRLSWFRRAGLRSMFLVHDLIPISHPEYFTPQEDIRHGNRIETIARHADVVIFNSKVTQAAWDAHAEAKGLARPYGAVVPLGVESRFLLGAEGRKVEAEIPYFVVVGTIEARKNLAFLLQVWKQWTQDGRAPRARLVVVGRRGWENENVVDLLDRSVALAPAVVEVAQLSDVGLTALLRGARALLAPSLIEGYGLPVAEALALGVPVIASDIEAHREVGGRYAEYLDPVDGLGWMVALEEFAQPNSPRRDAMRNRAATFRAHSWQDHMATVEAILADQSASLTPRG
ncbi:MAG TPA: glycosyltransferase family 1 protein [Vineibacter sp.]|nr:glycosyltransferase family 1 protein [Vineibacter sp.]